MTLKSEGQTTIQYLTDTLAKAKKEGVDIGKVSDGYYTFYELYQTREDMFLTICRLVKAAKLEDALGIVWRSRFHANGTGLEGYFIIGIGTGYGSQVTYHLKMDRWDDCHFARELDMAPEYDGHMGPEILERLKRI